MTAQISAPSVDASLRMRLLPAVLSVTAGCVDVITFLGLGGLFTAHITGNLVILAVRFAIDEKTPIAPMLSIPIFMAVLVLTRVLVAVLESIRVPSLRPLLLLQLLLLAGCLLVCAGGSAALDPNAASAIVGGMLAVAAMAVQNAIAQISLAGAPPTAVMTNNVTRFTMDLGEVLLGRNADDVARARRRANHTWPAIVGFTVGCCLGALCQVAFGLWSLAVPSGLALLALVMTFGAEHPPGAP